MCVGAILPVLSIAAGVGQAVVGYQAAQSEYQAGKQAYAVNLENAQRATVDRYEQINSRITQEEAAAAQEVQEARVEGLKARASASVAAAEGGVSGGSVDSIVRDMLAREARFVSATKKNLDYSREYLIGEQRAAHAQGQSQVNAVPRPRKPSFLPYAVQAFGSTINSFSRA